MSEAAKRVASAQGIAQTLINGYTSGSVDLRQMAALIANLNPSMAAYVALQVSTVMTEDHELALRKNLLHLVSTSSAPIQPLPPGDNAWAIFEAEAKCGSRVLGIEYPVMRGNTIMATLYDRAAAQELAGIIEKGQKDEREPRQASVSQSGTNV